MMEISTMIFLGGLIFLGGAFIGGVTTFFAMCLTFAISERYENQAKQEQEQDAKTAGK